MSWWIYVVAYLAAGLVIQGFYAQKDKTAVYEFGPLIGACWPLFLLYSLGTALGRVFS